MVDLYQKINDILGQRTFNCQKMSFHYDLIIPCDTPEYTFENEVMQEGVGVPLEATVEALGLPFTPAQLDNGFRHLLLQIATKSPTPRGFSMV
jgi:hypothetical protein